MSQNTKSGMAWSAASQACRVLLQTASTVLLARILDPKDFGVFAMVLPVVAFTALFQDMGLQQAVVQRDDITADQISNLFWLNLAATAVLSLVLVACSPLVATFYHEPRLVALTAAWGVTTLMGGFGYQHYAVMARAMRFKALALIDMACAIGGLATALIIACVFHSYWALWASGFSSVLLWVVLAGLTSGWRPTAPSRQADVRDMLSFGANLTVFGVANYISRNAGVLIIGRMAGAAALGFFDRAYKLLLFPLENIANPLARVLVPTLSRTQSDPQRQRDDFLRVVSPLNLACTPAVAAMIACSGEVTRVLLGPKWDPVAPLFFWLGFAGLLQLTVNALGWLATAQGRGSLLMRFGLFNALVSTVAFVVGAQQGVVGITRAYALSEYIVRFPLLVYVTGRRGSVRSVDLAAVTLPYVIAALVTVGASLGLRRFTTLDGLGLIAVVTTISYGCAIAGAALTSTGRATLDRARRLLFTALRPRRRPRAASAQLLTTVRQTFPRLVDVLGTPPLAPAPVVSPPRRAFGWKPRDAARRSART